VLKNTNYPLSSNSNSSLCCSKTKKIQSTVISKSNKDESNAVSQTARSKNSELFTFLMSPDIKAKIFEILYR